MKKKIAILGSTGSIGTQALEVIQENPDRFEVYAITANNNVELLISQAKAFLPEVVVVANEQKYAQVKEALCTLPIKVFAGEKAIAEVAEMDIIDLVVTAMVGYSGLAPTIAAIKTCKTIALANKETMVVAGEIICELAAKHKTPILPVDSEHSAIFQCLSGENFSSIEKLILTASGGPFRTKPIAELTKVTKADALKHPNWEMGAKITIDSATMMNKGFEVIEAKWLFGIPVSNIDVVVHPQSIIHSMVQFTDGSIKAQLGLPDMKLPIQYAMAYPERIPNQYPRLDFMKYPTLSFEAPDLNKFRHLAIAYEAIKQGGNMPCIINAANEIAVAAFLQEKIRFIEMAELIEKAMHKASFIKTPSYEDYVASDKETREISASLIS
jgi:1-deoxy-D-xylulose-5-phosphate reductoisomerase